MLDSMFPSSDSTSRIWTTAGARFTPYTQFHPTQVEIRESHTIDQISKLCRKCQVSPDRLRQSGGAHRYNLAFASPDLSTLTEGQKGYLAGILDGEGNITALRRHPDSFARWQISILNTNVPLMDWLRAKTGFTPAIDKRAGYIYLRTGKQHTKDIYRWRICGSINVLLLLELLLPYMIVKREMALTTITEIRKHPSLSPAKRLHQPDQRGELEPTGLSLRNSGQRR